MNTRKLFFLFSLVICSLMMLACVSAGDVNGTVDELSELGFEYADSDNVVSSQDVLSCGDEFHGV